MVSSSTAREIFFVMKYNFLLFEVVAYELVIRNSLLSLSYDKIDALTLVRTFQNDRGGPPLNDFDTF